MAGAPCGWCLDSNHEKCVGAIRLANGGLWFCTCGCDQATLRCVDCSNTTPGEVDPEDWECIDEHRGRLRRKVREQSSTPAPEKPQKAKPAPPRKAGKCLCCGEATKGGLFLPGHDSRYLSDVAKGIASGKFYLEGALTAWAAAGISEALQNKLRKRVQG